MNSILVSSIIFAFVFAAALIGMVVRVPEEHLGSDAKDVVRLATGLVATMASIILGMLVSSAKSSYDARKNDVAELSAEILTIDRMLARFGPEPMKSAANFVRWWNLVFTGSGRTRPRVRPISSRRTEARSLLTNWRRLRRRMIDRPPPRARLTSMVVTLKQTQWLLFLKVEQNAVPFPLLAVLVCWLAAIFLSFGLFAAPNSTTVATLAVSALAVSAAIFLILEMYTPFSGVLRISPRPILDALSQMGH